MLCDPDPAGLMSQLIAGQVPGAGEPRVQESGSVPPLQQGIPMSGLTANLSDPGALAALLQTGDPNMPRHLVLAAALSYLP